MEGYFHVGVVCVCPDNADPVSELGSWCWDPHQDAQGGPQVGYMSLCRKYEEHITSDANKN